MHPLSPAVLSVAISLTAQSHAEPEREGPVFRPVSRCVRGRGMGWRVYPPKPFQVGVAAFVGDVWKGPVNPAPAVGNRASGDGCFPPGHAMFRRFSPLIYPFDKSTR